MPTGFVRKPVAAMIPAALLDLLATPPRAVPPERLDAVLFEAAVAHDVVPLVAARLSARTDLPSDSAEGIALVREAEAARASELLAQLETILAALARADIPAIPLKGPVMALDLFGDAAARASRDLDILVPRAHAAHTLEALAPLGYAPDPALTPRLLRVLERYAGEHILFHVADAPVEPHWAPAPHTLAYDLDMPALWARSRPASVDAAPARALDPGDTLIWLAIHGAKEEWAGLKGVADVAAFVHRHLAIDWPDLRARAAAQGCARAVDVALLLAADLLGSRLPYAPVDRRALPIASAAAARLHALAPPPPSPYRLVRAHWSMRERARDRVAYAARTVCTPRAPHHARLRLPPALDWVHWLLKVPADYALGPLARRLRGGAVGR